MLSKDAAPTKDQEIDWKPTDKKISDRIIPTIPTFFRAKRIYSDQLGIRFESDRSDQKYNQLLELGLHESYFITLDKKMLPT